ncbi:glycosyltransferase family 4 protein [Methylocaldum sp. GT1BB]|uniref:glycosyltransferase family 4 protein n=1 Tax=Methylocaldum sp. GT1BB TaxID=3438963 RepID=UPI003DA100D8
MKLALITDAWLPQTNGVVTTLRTISEQLRAIGHTVETFTPDQFRNWPCPSYPEIRLALGCGSKLRARLNEFQPDAIHIATEGPLGMAARSFCKRRGLPFTSSFHTRFAEYIYLRTGLPLAVGYSFLRWFHGESERLMTATPTLLEELKARGFKNPVLWSRGVDTDLFRPRDKGFLPDARPVLLYAGRVAIEKNIEAFLKLDLPGAKYVVGDGPQREELESKYPDVRFVGYKYGEELARYLAAADVFVFPSRTDTFGLVMLEALASGVPVAAFPVEGPKDVILSGRVGCLDEDLKNAITEALKLDPKDCRQYALRYSWRDCALLFESYLAPIPKNGARSTAWWQRYS